MERRRRGTSSLVRGPNERTLQPNETEYSVNANRQSRRRNILSFRGKQNASNRIREQMPEFYYSIRRKLGLEPISQERLRQQRILEPEVDPEIIIREEDYQRIRQVLLCLGAALVLTLIVWLQGRGNVRTSLTRPSYGENDREVVLEVNSGDESYEVPVELRSLRYREDEVARKLEEAWQLALTNALGENPDWDHVSRSLNLGSETGVPGIHISWSSKDFSWITSGGEVREVTAESEEPNVLLTATLNYEGSTLEKNVTAHLVPPEHTPRESQIRRFQEALGELLADRDVQEVILPDRLAGESVTYPAEGDSSRWLIPGLGILAGVALWLLPGQKRKEALEKREKELEVSYSELIWKLTVLLGAGLTVRGAWERIVGNYQKDLQNGGEKSVLYEEMQITLNSLSQGVYEEKAYAEFGRRCGLSSYLRLGSLLETNVRQGRRGLLGQMQNEAEEAFQGRLQLARRQGEEASSKLLLPMMILFALVLGILLIPAMFSFRG